MQNAVNILRLKVIFNKKLKELEEKPHSSGFIHNKQLCII